MHDNYSKYENLNHLLSSCGDADEFFNELPDYVREHIDSRGDNVRTFESLRDFAENLLRGDD